MLVPFKPIGPIPIGTILSELKTFYERLEPSPEIKHNGFNTRN